MNILEPTLLSKPWNHNELYESFNAIGTEIEQARYTFPNLSARENDQDARITGLEAARGEFDNLLEREDDQGNRINSLENEVTVARQGEVSLFNTFQLYLKTADGFTQTINANGNRLTGLGLGINPSDSVNLSQVSAMLTLGGDPANISILDLSSEGLEPGQNIETSPDGQSIVGSQITVINANHQGLAGQNLVVNANNSFTIFLPQNPIPNITRIDFVAFTDKIGQNNITISPFGSELINGINQSVIIRKNQALRFIFIGGEEAGWLMIEQSTAGASVDTPNGFAQWYAAIKQPSVYNILKII